MNPRSSSRPLPGRGHVLRLATGILVPLLSCLQPAGVSGQQVRGIVRDATSQMPVAGAHVELIFVPDSVVGASQTGEEGGFALAIPAMGAYRVRVGIEGYETVTSAMFAANPARSVTADLKLRRRPTVAAPESAVVGIVKDAGANAPVSGANVTLVLLPDSVVGHAMTDDAGRFEFSDLSSDTFRVDVTHPDFVSLQSDPFLGGSSRRIDAEFTLGLPEVPYPEISRVVNENMLTRYGFYERKKKGAGYFLGPEEISGRAGDAWNIAELLRGLPGVEVVARADLGATDVIMRAGRSTSRGSRVGCFPSVFLDRVLVRRGGRTSRGSSVILNGFLPQEIGDPSGAEEAYWAEWSHAVPASEVAAIEAYPGAAGLPLFASGLRSPCGAIVIWTKGG